MYVQSGVGLLVSALSVPLIVRKVPMNRFYGVRIPKAFASERNWYELNEYGGKLFFVFGIVLFLIGRLYSRLAPDPSSLWVPVLQAGPLLLIFPILLLIRSYAKRLPD